MTVQAMCRFCYLLLLVFCLAVPAWGQSPTVYLKGKVLEEATGNPLAYVSITVRNQKASALSTDDGSFVLAVQRTDTLAILFSYPGYEVQEQVYRAPHPDTIKLPAVSMAEKEGEVQLISAATFKQTQDQLTVSTTTISPKALDQQAPSDIRAALTQLPGVNIYENQISIRGSSGYTFGAGSRVATVVNGMPVLNVDRSSAGFSLMPTDNIETIEVIKGSSSVLYGAGALGGMVNVITARPGLKPRTVIRTKIRYYDRPANDSVDWDRRSSAIAPSIHLFHSRRIGENFDLSAHLDLIGNSGIMRDVFNYRVRALLQMKYYLNLTKKSTDEDGNLVRKNAGQIQFGVDAQIVRDSFAVTIAWGGYPSNALIPGDGLNTLQNQERYMIDPSLVYIGPKGNRHSYRGRILFGIDDYSTPRDGYTNKIPSLLNYHDYNYTHYFGKRRNFTLVLGGNYQGMWCVGLSQYGAPEGHQAAGYAQAELKLWTDKNDPSQHRLSLSLGIRYQFEMITGKDDFRDTNSVVKSRITMNEPIVRAGINLRLHKATFIRASIGQGIRSPGFAERFLSASSGPVEVAPNAGVRAERGFTAEVGIRQAFRKGDGKLEMLTGFVDLAGFSMQFYDMVEFLLNREKSNNSSLVLNAGNISQANISGLEFSTNVDYRKNQFNLNFNGGVTWINPINPGGLKGLDGQESFLNVLIPPINTPYSAELRSLQYRYLNDQPYTLKYRNSLMARGSFSLGYGGVTLTANYRYTSQLLNYDKLFMVLDVFKAAIPLRARSTGGDHIVDLILAYTYRNAKVACTVSGHVFNVSNWEYMVVPGIMGEQRSYALQFKVEF